MSKSEPSVTLGRAVIIDGNVYDTATLAAHTLGVALPTLYSRLYSRSPTWAHWHYVDSRPVPTIKKKRSAPVTDWVVYKLRHKPSGKIYVGMTGNLKIRQAHHRHLLRFNKHNTPALQELYNQDPSPESWGWSGSIVSTREEALELEQLTVNELHASGLLLNGSLDTKAPIVYNMQSPEYRERQRQGQLRMVEANREAFVERVREQAKKRWSATATRKAWEGAGNPFAKKVKVDGVVYGSVKDAQRELRINEKTIRTRARDPNYPNYTFDV